jgi:hypothetical protein
MWATSVVFEILHKENNHQMGENSPNLVALILGYFSQTHLG